VLFKGISVRPSRSPDELKEQQKRAVYAMNLAMAERGFSQSALAREIGVERQYLWDVRNGHRSLTEPFAHRLAEVSGLSFVWIMYGEGVPIRRQPGTASGSGQALALPVLSDLCAGDPRQVKGWDGSLLEVVGSAAALAAGAASPYLLRLSFDAPASLLRKGDILLISQEKKPTSREIVIVERSRKAGEKAELLLVRRTGRGGFVSLDHGDAVRGEIEEIGQCLGLVWRAM
jgi:transcriptional regulator with XRE-family HTH domain